MRRKLYSLQNTWSSVPQFTGNQWSPKTGLGIVGKMFELYHTNGSQKGVTIANYKDLHRFEEMASSSHLLLLFGKLMEA